MADIGFINNLLGDDAFTRNNLLPWWEIFHNYFITIYVFAVITFGFTDSIESPHCLPLDGETVSEINEGEYEFVNAYCSHKDDDMTRLVRASMLVLALLGPIFLNKLLKAKKIEKCVKAYSDAQKTIENLGLSLDDLKQKAKSPVLDGKDSQSAEVTIRQVITKLKDYSFGDPTDWLLGRGVANVIILSVTFAVSLWFLIKSGSQKFGQYVHFDCDISLKDDIQWSGNFSSLICARPADTDFHFIILIICVSAMFVHVGVSGYGAIKLWRMKCKVRKQTGDINIESSTASRCMLFLAKIDKCADKNEPIFSDFVEFIFDKQQLLPHGYLRLWDIR